VPSNTQPARVVIWALHLALPLGGLWLLLARPQFDLFVLHTYTHFWLVLLVAGVNVALGVAMGAAAKHRGDGRLFLVSLVFLSSAGFLLAHALATPKVLIGHANGGFDLATALGLMIGSVLAFLSSLRLPIGVTRWQSAVRIAVALILVAWLFISLLDLPPLRNVQTAKEVAGPLIAMAAVAVVLYVFAAVRLYLVYRRRPSAVLISVVTGFALLAESMVAVTLADKWLLSWWEWHLILTFAYGFVAYSAYVEYRREGSSYGLFDGIAVSETTRRIRAEYEAALEEVVTALQDNESGQRDPAPIAARFAERFGLTEKQAAVLDRAGAALAAERDTSGRLAALVAVGEQARVGGSERDFVRDAVGALRAAFGAVHIGLVSDGVLEVAGRTYDSTTWQPTEVRRFDDRLLFPLTVKGRIAGAVEVPTPVDRSAGREAPAILRTLANQLSISLENARLYRELATLFGQYMSPDVAAALLADPDQAALGGSLVEVTALFADLRGFTTFSEGVPPDEIVTMLNRYHGVAVPCILDNGGTIVQFVGDALLALFNAPARQPDHAKQAVRAALDMQVAVGEIAQGRPDWPQFRVGANTGPALVGNIGSETLRGFNAMGDAVNVAARLQTLAEPGQVVIGAATRDAIGAAVSVRALGDLEVKGRRQTVRAFVVEAMA
jgi:adenylate cyclase